MALPDPARSRAVLIGASRFADPELPDLPAVRNNLDGLAACFRDRTRWGLPDPHCVVVSDPDSVVALVDPIHEAAVAAEDTLLIYYAGHGLVHPRTLGLLLALVGSRPGRPYTAVPYDEVRHNVVDSPAARKVVILDCCYSGRATGGMADPSSAVANEAIVEGTYLLASAPPNKQSLSPPGETYTTFTGALLTVLNEGVPNGPPLLQLDAIYRHVRDALKRASRPEPQLRVDNTAGELALVRNVWRRGPGPERAVRPEAGWADQARKHNLVRSRIRNLIGKAGAADAFACPVCQETVPRSNLVQHVDEHRPTQTALLDPATLRLEPREQDFDGRYRLGETIGGEGRFWVRVATDLRTNRTVVVKLVRNADDALVRSNLRTAATFNHPNIVQILDVRPTHIVLEYVDGPSLADLLETGKPIPPARATKIVADLCEALRYGHLSGIVHGDVNVGNVLLTRKNTVKVLNFGTRAVIGEGADIRSDLYFAGQVLIALLTGSVTGSRLGPSVPPALSKVIAKATNTDRVKRYQSAAEMRDALKSAL